MLNAKGHPNKLEFGAGSAVADGDPTATSTPCTG